MHQDSGTDQSSLSFGRRVRLYRLRRGMTQDVLAGLVGRSADWLGKVENDRLDVDRLSVIRQLAEVLGVAISDLTPRLPVAQHAPEQGAVDRIVAALSRFELAQPEAGKVNADEPPEELSVTRRLNNLFSDAQDGRFQRVARELPFLLLDTRALAATAPAGMALERAEGLYAMTCNAAEFTLSKLRRVQLAWLVSERGLAAADRTGDPLVRAALSRAVGHAIASNGEHANASVQLVRSAESLLGELGEGGGPSMWSVYGTMFLAASMAAARLSNRDDVNLFLAEARRAAGYLDGDANHLHTAFGPTNVAIHVVATSMELGDIHVGAEVGEAIDTSRLPIERRVRHSLETARANELLGRRDRAARILIRAWRESPDHVESHFLARRVTSELLNSKGKLPEELIRLGKSMKLL